MIKKGYQIGSLFFKYINFFIKIIIFDIIFFIYNFIALKMHRFIFLDSVSLESFWL
jgi:hypothetical protein